MVSMDSVNPALAKFERLSVIVPVLGDCEALVQLLADLRSQSRAPDSILVVSGRREEELAKVVREEQLTLIETAASRGLQLDTGARAADAEILWFIHADARVPRDACEKVVAAVNQGAAGGCLRFKLQGKRTLVKVLLEQLVRIRIACGGMAYGDQALFCTRDAYQASGGFPHRLLFEEVPLVRYLQKTCGFNALAVPVFVATRRWERDGWLQRSLHNRWLALRHMFGTPAETLAKAYRNANVSRDATPAQPKITEPHG
jgi:rSAM/selenodomain-associated transferase 2